MTQFTPRPAHQLSDAATNDVGGISSQFSSDTRLVVWNTIDGSDVTTAQTFARLVDAQGNALSAPMQLFTDPAFAQDGALAGGVATLADGSFVVLALSEHLNADHSPPAWNFYQERLSPDGSVVYGPAFVASYSSFDQPAARPGPVFAAPDGRSYYVELDLTDRFTNVGGTTTALKQYDLNGSLLGPDILASSLGYVEPDAAVLAGGNVLTAAASGRYGQWVQIEAHDAAGNLVGTGQVGRSTLGELNDFNPEIAAAANGRALLVSQHTEYDTTAQAYTPAQWQVHVVDATGQVLGDAHVLAAAQSASIVHLESLADGGALAWWGADTSYFAQALDANGNPSGDVIAIGTSVSSVTGTPDGGFFVESSLNGDVYEQKFDATDSASAHLAVNGGPTLIPAGDYAISGSAGIDTIAVSGAHTQYSVTQTSLAGPQGWDTLSGIERIAFGDGYAIALDVNGDAGLAYRLYQAAFHRAPDLEGLGYHIRDLDHGVSLSTVAAHFIESPEFQSTFGNVDDQQFITLLYENVLHRDPDQGGLAYHMNEFAQGQSRADMLTHFSESPENQANVIGQIQDGMLYVPLA